MISSKRIRFWLSSSFINNFSKDPKSCKPCLKILLIFGIQKSLNIVIQFTTLKPSLWKKCLIAQRLPRKNEDFVHLSFLILNFCHTTVSKIGGVIFNFLENDNIENQLKLLPCVWPLNK